MKISYAVNNLRSIGNMSPVELRPLTILVGANNSGKSTFLRSFSLLKQSLEEETNEPILWFERNGVDFDSFDTSVNKINSANQISLEFNFHDLKIRHPPYPFDLQPGIRNDIVSFDKVHYRICIKNHENGTYINQIDIDIKDYDLLFTVLFDRQSMLQQKVGTVRLPDIYLQNMFFSNDKLCGMVWTSSGIQPATFITGKIRKIILGILNTEYKDFASNREPLDVVHREAMRIAFSYPFDEERIRELREYSEIDCIKFFYSYLLENKQLSEFTDLQQHCAMNLILLVHRRLNRILRDNFESCTRIGPVRDLTERFFRIQPLNVSNISINGDNLPMFLQSLKMNKKLKKFSDWINKVIGYEIDVELEPGLMCVRVIDGELNLNLVDTGQGLSEILPVLAQIWMVIIGNESIPHRRQRMAGNSRTKIITLEQPELHLHPKHQANLADAFASALESFKFLDTKPIFIVETHSDVLINRMGALIENQVVSPQDVQVVLFSKSDSTLNSTEVSTSRFDEEGVLIDWPQGFFNY